MKKTAIFVICAALVIIGGYFGYEKYQGYKLIESLKPLVKNASVRVTNELRFETESSKITFKELFEKLEADIVEIDKKIIEVQSLSNPKNKEKIDIIAAYLQGCQELLRVVLLKNRKDLKFTSAVEWSNKTIESIKSATSSFGIEYAAKTAKEAVKDIEEADKERAQANLDFITSVIKLEELYNNTLQVMPIDTLVDITILEKCVSLNKSKDEAKSKTDTKKNNDEAGVAQINFVDYRERFIKNEKEGNLFIIEGKIINNYNNPRNNISISGKIFTSAKQMLQQKTIFAGNMIPNKELESLSMKEIESLLSNKDGINSINKNVPSGKEVPFMIVFSKLQNNLDTYSVEVVSSL